MDADRQRVLGRIRSRVTAVGFLPESSLVVTAGAGGALQLFTFEDSAAAAAELPGPDNLGCTVRQIYFPCAGDPSLALLAADGGGLFCYDALRRLPLRTLRPPPQAPVSEPLSTAAGISEPTASSRRDSGAAGAASGRFSLPSLSCSGSLLVAQLETSLNPSDPSDPGAIPETAHPSDAPSVVLVYDFVRGLPEGSGRDGSEGACASAEPAAVDENSCEGREENASGVGSVITDEREAFGRVPVAPVAPEENVAHKVAPTRASKVCLKSPQLDEMAWVMSL